MGQTLDIIMDMEGVMARSETDLTPWFHDDYVWDGNAGCGRKEGVEAWQTGWQTPFRATFGNRSYDAPVWIEDGDWAACFGTCTATHDAEFMGIPATGKPVWIPYVNIARVRDGRIAYNKADVDLPCVAAQLGHDIFKGHGWDRHLDFPVRRLYRGKSGQGASRPPLNVVHEMEAALQRSDVDVSDYFHDDFVWDANYGCGLKHGLSEFESGWYLPFRVAFGNRDFRTELFVQQGDWAACYGACHATLDTDFLGVKATGQKIRVPYIDFWRIEGDKIAENVVRVDFASILRQIGHDPFNGHGWDGAP